MTDERDPLVADALRRLAGAAPQPRPDRLQAVVAGVRRRRQVRTTTSALTAAVLVVAAAVGVPADIQYQPPRPGDVRDSQADCSRLRELFPGATPVAWTRTFSARWPGFR